jgi:ABC-type branched-subunit amino acid transport system substrate-binding protein
MRLLLTACFLLLSLPASAQTLDVDQAAGKALFRAGTGAAGPVGAAVGAGQVEVPAASLPCASCHGRDGRGRPEGAVAPPDITAPVLRAPAATRRGYDDAAIVAAVTLGRDVEGRPLDPVMPRYRLSLADAGHLTSYLKTLGMTPEPGLTPDRLVLGTILARPDAPAGKLLQAFFDRLDAAGGLFGRKLALVVAPPADSPSDAARRLLAAQPVFALVAPWIAQDERGFADLAEAEDLPAIGAETLRPDAAGPAPHGVFFLDGGVPAEAQALAIAADRLGAAPAMIVAAPPFAGPADRDWIGTPPQRRLLGAGDTPAALVRALLGAGIGRILWLAPGLDAFAAAAAESGYHPALLAPAEFAPAKLPITVALRSGPADRSEAGLDDYRDLARQAGLPDEDRPAQLRALAAARLLVAALERAGHDVTREKLIAALEATGDFRTGLVPPLSYGASRRIGSTGAWILSPDGTVVWVDPARR